MSEQLESAPEAARLGSSPWLWMTLGCVLVAGSGMVRVHQERLFADASISAKASPFSLRDLPRTLGDHWVMEGEELELTAQTQQIAGCTDYVYRDYSDSRTGTVLRVLVAFGPAISVFPHAPDVCFPSQGFQPRGESRVIQAIPDDGPDGSGTARFRVMAFGKPDAGREILIESTFSFWHDGRWDAEARDTKHRFQHQPAMFKIQVDRSINERELKSLDQTPSKEFAAALLREINQRLAPHADGPRPAEGTPAE